MDQGISISVVMAAYNAESTIVEAIESILSQTYKMFEFIIINDGSIDKTEEIIKRYKDKRIVYIKNNENLKLIASLNKGLEIAKGKYIARMDADDISNKNRLQKQFEFMEKNPEIGISGCQLELFGDHTGFMNYSIEDEDIKLDLLITSTFGNNAVIFRNDIFRKNNLYFPEGYIHAEDYKLWTLWSKYSKMGNLDIVLVKYRSHNESISNKYKIEQRYTRNRIRKEYLESIFKEIDYIHVENFYSKPSFKRVKASIYFIKKNNENGHFNKIKFEDIIKKLWYSDCLEYSEKSILGFFYFPLEILILKRYRFSKHIIILKHYIKSKIS
jgi:glycosyltransferase involved in cell wall biosynthesis